jgi:hypothetical protein
VGRAVAAVAVATWTAVGRAGRAARRGVTAGTTAAARGGRTIVAGAAATTRVLAAVAAATGRRLRAEPHLERAVDGDDGPGYFDQDDRRAGEPCHGAPTRAGRGTAGRHRSPVAGTVVRGNRPRADAPATEGAGDEVSLVAVAANPRGPTAVGPAADGYGGTVVAGQVGAPLEASPDGRTVRLRAVRRDGIVVPLGVPARTRLRALSGLAVMVVVLGSIAAALVAAVALAGAVALGNL